MDTSGLGNAVFGFFMSRYSKTVEDAIAESTGINASVSDFIPLQS